MQHPVTLPSALALFAALLLWGCSPGQVWSYCEDNADCETNLTCFQNQCLLLGTIPEGLVWEIVPTTNAPAQTLRTNQQIQPLQLSTCATEVRGDLGSATRIRVDIEGESALLPGQCRSDQRVLGGTFSLALPPGTWRVTFLPEGGPPFSRRFGLERCEILDLGELQPDGGTRTVRFVPTYHERDPRPRCGVRVQAFDPIRGDPLSTSLEMGLTESFTCIPPFQDGWELEVAPPAEGKGLALLFESASSAAPIFRSFVHWAELEGETTLLGEIPVGSVPAERATLLVTDGNGHPVDGVRIHAQWPEGQRERGCIPTRFEPAAEVEEGPFRSAPAKPTGNPGTYEMWLPPGPYQFLGVPPAATKLAVGFAEPSQIVRAGGGNLLLLRLEEKHPMGGAVTGPAKRPLGAARIVALPLGSGMARPFETQSDARGLFALSVDPGRYVLLVDPLQEDLPKAWRFLGNVAGPRTDNFSIPDSVVVAGIIRTQGPEGEERFLASTLVRAWQVGGEVPILAGEAITDPSGRFVVRLLR